jgi:Na+/glutamate symporter
VNKNLPLYFAMAIATIFVALFCVAFTYDLLNKDYDIPPGLYPLMTIIVGAIMGFVFKRSSDGV